MFGTTPPPLPGIAGNRLPFKTRLKHRNWITAEPERLRMMRHWWQTLRFLRAKSSARMFLGPVFPAPSPAGGPCGSDGNYYVLTLTLMLSQILMLSRFLTVTMVLRRCRQRRFPERHSTRGCRWKLFVLRPRLFQQPRFHLRLRVRLHRCFHLFGVFFLCLQL